MQGALVGAMVCAVQAGVGFGRVALAISQTLPAQYPLGADLAAVPYVPMLVMLVATFGFVVTASVGPAAYLRIAEVTQQSKSYTAAEAQHDFAPAQLAAWTKVGLIAALVSWPLLVILFRWQPSSPRLPAEVTYAVVLLAPAVVVAVSIPSVVAGFDWLVKRIRDHLWRRSKLESGARVSLSTGGLVTALCAGLVVFFQAFMVGWPATSTSRAQSGYESYNLASQGNEIPDDVIRRIHNSGEFSGVQMSPVFDLGTAPTSGAEERKLETHVLPGTCWEANGRLVDGRGVVSCQPQIWTRMHLTVMRIDDLRTKYALNEAEVSKLAAGIALVRRTSHAAETTQYRDGVTLDRFSRTRGTGGRTTVASRVSMPVQTKTVESIPARAGNFRVLVAQEYLQQNGVATYASQLETRRRVSLNWWEKQRLLSLIGGEQSNAFASTRTFGFSRSSRVLMSVAGFLGVLVALSSLGAAGQVRALRDLGASFGRRYRVVAQYCALAGLVVAFAGSVFGVFAGGLVSGAAVLTTHDSYVSWQQPLWQYMWIPLLIPLVAVLCAAPLTSVWSRSATDAVASGKWHQLHFLGVGVTVAIVAVSVWLVITGGIGI